jgi:hypothetical protein
MKEPLFIADRVNISREDQVGTSAGLSATYNGYLNNGTVQNGTVISVLHGKSAIGDWTATFRYEGVEKSTATASSVSTPQPVPEPIPLAAPVLPTVTGTQSGDKPRIYLSSASIGANWNAARDQSMEMSKDFERDCTGLRITINPQMADYTIRLNHIEHGFRRDNQIQIADKRGDLITKTKEGGSIAGDMKKACALILSDWARK